MDDNWKKTHLERKALNFPKLFASRRRRCLDVKANVGVMVVIEKLLASMSEGICSTLRPFASAFARTLLDLLEQAQLGILPPVIVMRSFLPAVAEVRNAEF